MFAKHRDSIKPLLVEKALTTDCVKMMLYMMARFDTEANISMSMRKVSEKNAR